MTDREFIDNMKILLEPINNKLEMMENEKIGRASCRERV